LAIRLFPQNATAANRLHGRPARWVISHPWPIPIQFVRPVYGISKTPRSCDNNAWAAGDTSRWWECDEEGPIDVPGVYWAEGAQYGFRLDASTNADETRGYSICQDAVLEEGSEELVLYAEKGEWRHAARLLGRFTNELRTPRRWSGACTIRASITREPCA
jgi:hypothetical protein